MSIEPIGVLTILIGLICLMLGAGALVNGLAVMAVLGAAAAMLIGAANIQPGHVMLVFLAFGVLSRRREAAAALRALHPNEPGFWFTCLVAYGVASAFLMPRVFAGITEIIPLGTTAFDDTGSTVPLAPVSSNVTQSLYLSTTLLCLITLTAIAATREGFSAVFTALLACCVANTVFAVLDIATYATGTQELLGFIRNARYTLHTDSEIAGMKRIVGSYTEASVFARSTLGVLGFTGTLWLCGVRPGLTGTIAGLSLALIVLSTSSTGLAGAPVMLLLLYAFAIARLVLGNAARQAAIFALGAPVIGLLAVVLLLLDPDATAKVYGYVDLVVLNKASSDSGIERSSWNVVSFQNFLDSWGLGVGLGTARASSFAVALLASVGIPGALFYAVFVFECFLRPRGQPGSLEADIAVATRNGYAGLLIGDLLVGPIIDQGFFFCMLAALAAAIRPRTSSVPRPLPVFTGARI
jgi:hypothetical protein